MAYGDINQGGLVYNGARGTGSIYSQPEKNDVGGYQQNQLRYRGTSGLAADPFQQIYDPLPNVRFGNPNPRSNMVTQSGISNQAPALAPKSYEDLLGRSSTPGQFDWGDYFRPLLAGSGNLSGYDYDLGQEAFKQYQGIAGEGLARGGQADPYGTFNPYAFSQMDETKNYLNNSFDPSDPRYGSLMNSSFVYNPFSGQNGMQGANLADPLTGQSRGSYGFVSKLYPGAEQEFLARAAQRLGPAYIMGKSV